MIVPCKDNEKRDYMFFVDCMAGFAVRPESGFMRRSGRGPRLRVAVRREKRGTRLGAYLKTLAGCARLFRGEGGLHGLQTLYS